MLDWQAVKDRANDDAEFRLHARFWNSVVKLGVGERRFKMTVDSGAIVDIEPWLGGIAGNLSISAPEADWEALLEAVPRPFYQDLYPASIHHGFDVAGDTVNYCAYYPAVRRLVEIMREVKNG